MAEDNKNTENKENNENNKVDIKIDNESDDQDLNQGLNEDTENKEQKNMEKSFIDRINKLEEKCKLSEDKAKENYDRFLRISAEYENYKKRNARELSDFRKFANEMLIKELLTIVDNLERAIDSSKSDQKGGALLIEGVEMILNQTLKIFKKFAAKPIKTFEEPFNPSFHQAVSQEENNDYPSNTVIKELQKGYMLHDRLLRPAMVIVSNKDEKAQINKDNDEKENKENENL